MAPKKAPIKRQKRPPRPFFINETYSQIMAGDPGFSLGQFLPEKQIFSPKEIIQTANPV